MSYELDEKGLAVEIIYIESARHSNANLLAEGGHKRIGSFKQKRKTNEHIREEQLENLYKAFRARSYESVTESQGSDYVIEEIKTLL